jgi:hypothetical protein
MPLALVVLPTGYVSAARSTPMAASGALQAQIRSAINWIAETLRKESLFESEIVRWECKR